MSNQHAVSTTGLAIPSTAEIVVCTLTPFTENNPVGAGGGPALAGIPGIGAQGVVLDFNMNITPSAGATCTIKFRYGSLTGAVIQGFPAGGTVTTLTTTIANGVAAWALDPTISEVNAVYVVTIAISSGTATVNYAVLAAQAATSFE